jgi:hypothetical protein
MKDKPESLVVWVLSFADFMAVEGILRAEDNKKSIFFYDWQSETALFFFKKTLKNLILELQGVIATIVDIRQVWFRVYDVSSLAIQNATYDPN